MPTKKPARNGEQKKKPKSISFLTIAMICCRKFSHIYRKVLLKLIFFVVRFFFSVIRFSAQKIIILWQRKNVGISLTSFLYLTILRLISFQQSNNTNEQKNVSNNLSYKSFDISKGGDEKHTNMKVHQPKCFPHQTKTIWFGNIENFNIFFHLFPYESVEELCRLRSLSLGWPLEMYVWNAHSVHCI